MDSKRYELILASQSPRRKELLSLLEIPFRTFVAHAKEESQETKPIAFVEDIAQQKAMAAWEQLSDQEKACALIVASDTIVCLNEEILGKPKDIEQARQMLLKLSGKTHAVITSICMCALDQQSKKLKKHSFSIQTKVSFDKLSSDILDRYLVTKDSLDKAGAYGIQHYGNLFVSQIEGSYSNVVGFPLSDFIVELKKFLECSEDDQGEWRQLFKGKGNP